jgi:hypothetical protein
MLVKQRAYRHSPICAPSACAFRDEGQFIGRFPAVVAPIPPDRVVSAQRPSLSDRIPAGQRKKEMPSRPRDGAAIRLFDTTRSRHRRRRRHRTRRLRNLQRPDLAALDAQPQALHRPPASPPHRLRRQRSLFVGQAPPTRLPNGLPGRRPAAVKLPDEPGTD